MTLWQAQCSRCKWQGPVQGERLEAFRDGQMHVAEKPEHDNYTIIKRTESRVEELGGDTWDDNAGMTEMQKRMFE